jgi:hypothetical protein
MQANYLSTASAYSLAALARIEYMLATTFLLPLYRPVVVVYYEQNQVSCLLIGRLIRSS